MSHEEDGSDAQEWKGIIDEEYETSESLSLNLVDKKTEFCFRSLVKKKSKLPCIFLLRGTELVK